jgi:hypothetical protein
LTFQYTLTRGAEVNMALHTLTGRLVAQVPVTASRAGVNVAPWDRRDATGRPVPAGMYLVVVTATGEDGEPFRAVRTVRVE